MTTAIRSKNSANLNANANAPTKIFLSSYAGESDLRVYTRNHVLAEFLIGNDFNFDDQRLGYMVSSCRLEELKKGAAAQGMGLIVRPEIVLGDRSATVLCFGKTMTLAEESWLAGSINYLTYVEHLYRVVEAVKVEKADLGFTLQDWHISLGLNKRTSQDDRLVYEVIARNFKNAHLCAFGPSHLRRLASLGQLGVHIVKKNQQLTTYQLDELRKVITSDLKTETNSMQLDFALIRLLAEIQGQPDPADDKGDETPLPKPDNPGGNDDNSDEDESTVCEQMRSAADTIFKLRKSMRSSRKKFAKDLEAENRQLSRKDKLNLRYVVESFTQDIGLANEDLSALQTLRAW